MLRIKTRIAIYGNTSHNTDEYGVIFSPYSVVFYAVILTQGDLRYRTFRQRIILYYIKSAVATLKERFNSFHRATLNMYFLLKWKLGNLFRFLSSQLTREPTRRLMSVVYVHCFDVLHSLPW